MQQNPTSLVKLINSLFNPLYKFYTNHKEDIDTIYSKATIKEHNYLSNLKENIKSTLLHFTFDGKIYQEPIIYELKMHRIFLSLELISELAELYWKERKDRDMNYTKIIEWIKEIKLIPFMTKYVDVKQSIKDLLNYYNNKSLWPSLVEEIKGANNIYEFLAVLSGRKIVFRKFMEIINPYIEADLEHAYSVAHNNNIKSIINYRFGEITPVKLIEELKILEEKFFLENPDLGSKLKHADLDWGKTVIQYEDNFFWEVLDSPTSKKEAQAMQHCGGYGDNVMWSLRKRYKDKKGNYTLFTVHVTMMVVYEVKKPKDFKELKTYVPTGLEKVDNYIGYVKELKGKQNFKPIPPYFSYIIDIFVRGNATINWGGGYLHENDFLFNDLLIPHDEEVYDIAYPDYQKKSELLFELVKTKIPHVLKFKNLLDYLGDELFLKLLNKIELLDSKTGYIEIGEISEVLDYLNDSSVVFETSRNSDRKSWIKWAHKILNFEDDYMFFSSSEINLNEYQTEISELLEKYRKKLKNASIDFRMETMIIYTKNRKKYEIEWDDVNKILTNVIIRGIESATTDALYNLVSNIVLEAASTNFPLVQAPNGKYYYDIKAKEFAEKFDEILKKNHTYLDCITILEENDLTFSSMSDLILHDVVVYTRSTDSFDWESPNIDIMLEYFTDEMNQLLYDVVESAKNKE